MEINKVWVLFDLFMFGFDGILFFKQSAENHFDEGYKCLQWLELVKEDVKKNSKIEIENSGITKNKIISS